MLPQLYDGSTLIHDICSSSNSSISCMCAWLADCWLDDKCRQLRRKSRLLEHRYQRSGLADDRKPWVEHERLRHQVYRRKERLYWSMRVNAQAKQPRQLWRSLNTLMGASEKNSLPKNCPTAQQFANFFEAKIAAVLAVVTLQQNFHQLLKLSIGFSPAASLTLKQP